MTTFYVVVPEGTRSVLYAMKACGKAPLAFNLLQYRNQNSSKFVNHAQMAAIASDRPMGSTVTVVAAGEMDVINGGIVYMDNCSGHFKPTIGATLSYVSQLTAPLAVPHPLMLSQPLHAAVSDGAINAASIAQNFIRQLPGGANDVPQRKINNTTGHQTGVRAGTGDYNSAHPNIKKINIVKGL
ncbi:hypothetical protein [Aliiroseovarius sp. 2305UL8-7]|uniref:hypothetical protein n=1 Tax=Aliiroseovarius conchicola TaxID=3121637 RepID=UPI003528F92B